jgi:uncharacterized membrane protein YoaK (UPF0700 family)
MIAYEVYKVLHLTTLFLFVSAIGFVLNQQVKDKFNKTIIIVISFLVFVAGMGLIARLGFKHTEPFPVWIYIKISCWLLLNTMLIFREKIPNFVQKYLYIFCMSFIALAVWAAIYKPI